MHPNHARTSAAFLADAKARCEAAASIPADAAAADQAIAAIEAGLIQSGAVEAPAMSARDRAATILSIETMRAKADRAGPVDAARLRAAAARLEADLAEVPAMVPQQAQQQQANAAPLYVFQVRGEAADMARVRTSQDVEGITPRTVKAQTVTVRTRADWYAFSRACRTVARDNVERRRGGESIFWAMMGGRVHRLSVERHSFGSVQRPGGRWHRVCHGSPVALSTARLTERPRRALIGAELAWAARYRANAMRDARERQAHRRALSVQAVRACIVEARGLWSALDRLPG